MAMKTISTEDAIRRFVLSVKALSNGALLEYDGAGGVRASALFGGTYTGNLTITGNLQVDGTTLLQSATTVAGVAKFADGTVGAPSVTFTTGLTSGLYHSGTTAGDNEVVSLAITGVAKVSVSKAGMVINGASGLGAKLAVIDTV